jgi:hypothetical protein
MSENAARNAKSSEEYSKIQADYINANPLHDASGKAMTKDQENKRTQEYNKYDYSELKRINETLKEQTGIHKDVAANVEAESRVIVDSSKKGGSGSITSYDSGAASMFGGKGNGGMSFPGGGSFSDYDSMAAAMFGFGGFDGGFKFADGGKVPGQGNKDTVPAMLTPGELVLTREEAKKWEMMNHSLDKNRFALGGYVGGMGASSSSIGSNPSSGMPNISINVKGDTANKIMKSVTTQLSTVVNHMMTPSGTTSRFFDRGRS